MRVSGAAFGLLTATVLFAGAASAQSGSVSFGASAGSSGAAAQGSAAQKPAATAPTPAQDKTAEGVRRDPKGVQGISPFWEELKVGDSAYLARSFDVALEHYKKATMLDPAQALGHLRMAEAQLRLNQLSDAEQSLVAAQRFSERDLALRAKTFFMLADLRERQGKLDEAIATWQAYEKLATGPSPSSKAVGSQGAAPPPAPKIFVETAQERVKRLQAKKELDAAYAAVRERIQKRLDEAQKSAEESAQTSKTK